MRVALSGAPIEVTASYIRPAMMRPSSGGRNQRERTNSDSFCRTSRSRIAPSMPVLAAPHRNGLRNHLLQAPARVSGDSSTVTSALSSHRSRIGSIGRSWLSARASMVPLMPPAEAPAMMSTTTRSSMLAADLAQQLEIDGLGVVFGIVAVGAIEERRLRALRAVGNAVQRARGAHELQDLLADAVHVDGERHAAEADERNAKFFLAQGAAPRPG